MDSYFKDSWQGEEWKASGVGIFFLLRDKFLSASNTNTKTDQFPKALTTEAVLTICVLSSFVILSLAGSSVTAFEYFFKANVKKASIAEKKRKKFQHSDDDGLLGELIQVFKCFCLVTNTKKILARTTSKKNEISCVNGIRIIFFIWCIFFHTSYLYIGTIKNLEDQGPYLRSWLPKAILKGDYLNDAFFTLGGFLNALNFFQEYDGKRGNISWFNFYMKKIVKITPLYMIILSFYATLFPYLGSGPVWPTYSTNPICKRIWWSNLLFVNNILKLQNQCMSWTWYLGNYMQMFLISPLFLISLIRWPKFGFILTCICISGSCLLKFLTTKIYNFTMVDFRIGYHLSDLQGYFIGSLEACNTLMYKPLMRLDSYLIGILLGHYLSSTIKGKTTEKNLAFLCCGWIVTAICTWSCLSALGSTEESLNEFAVFNGLRHLVFSCVVSWFIYVCSTGQAKFINQWLSCHVFVVLSRLSFSGYLIHMIYLENLSLSMMELGEFSVKNLVLRFAYVFLRTCVTSFVVSAVFEIPVSRLYSLITSKRKKNEEYSSYHKL